MSCSVESNWDSEFDKIVDWGVEGEGMNEGIVLLGFVQERLKVWEEDWVCASEEDYGKS